MVQKRTISLSLTVAALAVLSAGCQSSRSTDAAAAPVVAGNTSEMCDAFRHFEVDHTDDSGSSLSSYNATFASDMSKLAGRATDATVSAQLGAIASQFSVLADQKPGWDVDQVERDNPEVFTAAEQAWVDLESRCGKAIVPTP